MSYRILTCVVLSNFLSLAYAIDNRIMNESLLPQNASISRTYSQAEKGSAKALYLVDAYTHCFKNSTWIVPPQTLLAYLYDNGTTAPVVDQTVWVISNYNQGYFSGISYTAINNSALSQRYLIGSVTSEGKVYITFYSGTSSSTSLVNGIGTLSTKSSGQCSFIMQMNSGTNGVSGLTHWSYMVPVNPGEPFYNNLPGTQMSVPQFLAQF